MIWLTEAALRYAVNICVEIPDYEIVVYTNTAEESNNTKLKLSTFVKNNGATIHDMLNWHASFNNGSKIRVYSNPATFGTRGTRSNLAIVSQCIDPKVIHDDIVTREFNRTPDGGPFPFADGGYTNRNGTFIEGEDGVELVDARIFNGATPRDLGWTIVDTIDTRVPPDLLQTTLTTTTEMQGPWTF